ncbi:MAG: Hint domain-containing protein [Proteobacteria bacterium]|nr:Hint domain-containing protein [Pseudomonadota bacterium]
MLAGVAATYAPVGKSTLKPIVDIRPGDRVLAFAEWKGKGTDAKADDRLSYERVEHVIASEHQQRLMHITLASGETLTATDGHPFMTPDGWRDAILLKKGGQLLLKGDGEPPKTGAAQARNTATIADVSTETRIVKVFNLEVENAHTYFVGKDGVGVHNTQGHHSDPKFLGGDPKQPLTDLPDALHRDLHREMNVHLDNYSKYGRTMRPKRGNCGQKIRATFTRDERLDALGDFYRSNDTKFSDAAFDFFDQHPNRR